MKKKTRLNLTDNLFYNVVLTFFEKSPSNLMLLPTYS